MNSIKKILISIIIFIIIVFSIYRYFAYKIDKEILRVEILNGTNIRNLASYASQFFKDKKLDVIIISNAEFDTISKTVVIDRLNSNCKYGKYVAKKINCSNVIAEIDSSLYIDVTIIIGSDYKKYIKEKDIE